MSLTNAAYTRRWKRAGDAAGAIHDREALHYANGSTALHEGQRCVLPVSVEYRRKAGGWGMDGKRASEVVALKIHRQFLRQG